MGSFFVNFKLHLHFLFHQQTPSLYCTYIMSLPPSSDFYYCITTRPNFLSRPLHNSYYTVLYTHTHTAFSSFLLYSLHVTTHPSFSNILLTILVILFYTPPPLYTHILVLLHSFITFLFCSSHTPCTPRVTFYPLSLLLYFLSLSVT